MFNNLRDILGRKSDQMRNEQADFPSAVENEDSTVVAAEGFICPMCKSGFPNAEELQNHYESNHVEGINSEAGYGRIFTCSACKMKLGSDIELQSHYSRHHAVAKKDQGEIEILNMQIKALDEGKSLLQDELKFMHQQLKEYMKENSNIKEEREALNLREKKLISSNVELIKEVEEKRKLLQKYEKQCIDSDEYIKNMKIELKNTKAEFEQMKIGRDELFCKINEGKGATTAVSQLKDEIAKLVEESTCQQNANDVIVEKLHKQIHALNDELKDLKLKLQENKDLNCKLYEAEKSLSYVTDENHALHLELKNQQADMDKKEASQICQLKKVEEDLNGAKNELNAKSEQLACVVNDLNMMLDDLKEENKILKAKIDDLQISKDAVIKGQEEQLTVLQNKCIFLSKQIELEKSTCQEAAKQVGDLKHSVQEANVKLTNMANDASNNKAIINEYQQQIEMLSKERTEYKGDNEQLHLELNRMQDYDEVLAKNEICEEEILQLRSKIQISDSEKSHLMSEFDDVKTRFTKTVADKTNTITHLQKLLVDASEIHNQESKELQNMKQLNIDEKMKFQNEIKAMKNCYKETIEERNKIIDDYKNQNQELQKKTDLFSSKVEELENSLVQRHQEWEQSSAHFQAQIGILNENINTLQEDLKSEQNQCLHLNEKLVEISGNKLELEAKLKIALDERTDLLERCRKSEDGNESLLMRNTELRRKLDDSIAALHELGRENQTLQIENLKHLGRKWADDSEVTHCGACGKLFTVTIRKHHCRNCGDIFCNECSSKTAAVASSRKPVRVCQVCYTELIK